MFILLAVIGDKFFPLDKNTTTETKLEVTSITKNQNSKVEENNNVKEWFTLTDKKKEKFIEKNIEGSWLQIMQVALINKDNENKIIINKNFKFEYKSTDDYDSYRGKYSFSTLVINSEKLLLKWNIKNKTYYIAGVL